MADGQSHCDTSEEVRTTRWRRAVEPVGTPAGLDTPRRRRRRDGGFSIIEIVITITLMGVVVVPILAAVVAGIRASSVSLTAAEVETVLINAVDRVNRAPRTVGSPVFPCDLTAPVLASVEVHGWPPSSATVGHEYLDPSGVWQTDPSGTACPGGVFKNGLVQRITVTVTSPEHDVSRSLQVVRGGGEIDI